AAAMVDQEGRHGDAEAARRTGKESAGRPGQPPTGEREEPDGHASYSARRSTSPRRSISTARVWPPSWRKRAIRARAAAVARERVKQSASSRRPCAIGGSAAWTA